MIMLMVSRGYSILENYYYDSVVGKNTIPASVFLDVCQIQSTLLSYQGGLETN